jgi:multidrug efflux system membrane fusion protein
MSEERSQNSGSRGIDPSHALEAQTGNRDQYGRLRNGAPERKRRVWFWVVGILLALIVGFLVYRMLSKSGSGAGKPAAGAGGGRGQTGPATITIGQSKTGDINIYDDALGTVTPLATVTIYSQITGRVMNVYYREGQIVSKGQPLVDIDPRPYEATLTQAEGQLQHDQGVLAEARIDLARYQAAYAKNAIAKQQLDDQEQIVVQDEGTVKADEGTVEYDKVQLSYCHIVSPINGRVGLRLVDPGNTIFSGSSSTLVVITQLQPITVVFNVSEDDLPQVQAQMKTNRAMEVDAYDRADEKQIEAGKLTSLDNEVDTTTGTVKFRATFPNKNLVLFPNQFVNARLLVKTLKSVTLVPTAAVQHNGTAAFVYIVNANQTVGVQPITVLTTNENQTAATGVGAGVNLATSGFDRLENGVHVQVAQPARKSTPGATATTSSAGTSAP